jgi:hypothetical protein
MALQKSFFVFYQFNQVDCKFLIRLLGEHVSEMDALIKYAFLQPFTITYLHKTLHYQN